MSKIVTKIFTDAQIDAAIVKVGGDAKSLQQRIHNIAVSVIKIWHDAKDDAAAAKVAVGRLNALQGQSPYHASAFAKWVQVMLPVCVWSEEAKAWYVDADNSRLMGKVFMAARDNPFWMVKPASVPKPMDLSDELERLIKKVEKRLETPVDGDAINVAALKLLRSARDLPVAA